jgi:hypothetical protein
MPVPILFSAQTGKPYDSKAQLLLDPLQNDASEPDPPGPGGEPPTSDYPHHGDMSDPTSGCAVDGIPTLCTTISVLLGLGGGFVKSVSAGLNGPMVATNYSWKYNPSIGGGDACKNGKCPDVVVVKDPGGYFAIAGYTVISSGLLPQKSAMTSDQVTAIRDSIGGMLTDACANFIDKLISAQTGKPYDSKTQLLTDFDKVTSGKGGLFWGGNQPGSGGDAPGSIATGNASIQIDRSKYFADSHTPSTAATAALSVRNAASTTLHELIHAVTGMGDVGLSRQVRKLGIPVVAFGYPGNIMPYPTDTDPTDTNNSKLSYSKYWGGALNNVCH